MTQDMDRLSSCTPYPFRLGTTSYIIPADILPNVRFLAGQVQDVELVLFEVDDGPNNLPSAETLAGLAELSAAHALTYTVHLPLDLKLGASGEAGHVSLAKARRVIEATRMLNPWAYVLHLDGKDIKHGASYAQKDAWCEQAVRALEIVAVWAGGCERLAVENVEGYPLDFATPVLERVPVSRCVDVGHLWLDGHDPLPFLAQALPRTRVIHIHGLAGRDHKSLAHMPREKLVPVLKLLLAERYTGVLTLEVFGEADFFSSKQALEQTLEDLWEKA